MATPDNREVFANARFSLASQDAPIGFVGELTASEKFRGLVGISERGVLQRPSGTQVGKMDKMGLKWPEVIGDLGKPNCNRSTRRAQEIFSILDLKSKYQTSMVEFFLT